MRGETGEEGEATMFSQMHWISPFQKAELKLHVTHEEVMLACSLVSAPMQSRVSMWTEMGSLIRVFHLRSCSSRRGLQALVTAPIQETNETPNSRVRQELGSTEFWQAMPNRGCILSGILGHHQVVYIQQGACIAALVGPLAALGQRC